MKSRIENPGVMPTAAVGAGMVSSSVRLAQSAKHVFGRVSSQIAERVGIDLAVRQAWLDWPRSDKNPGPMCKRPPLSKLTEGDFYHSVTDASLDNP